MRFPRPRLPKFSLADVLLVTAAFATALAASTAPEEDDTTLIGGVFPAYAGDTDEATGLIVFGSLLLATVVAKHAFAIWRHPATDNDPYGWFRRLACASRFMLAAAIAVLSVLVILTNRQLIELPERSGSFAFLSPLWPDVMLAVATLAAIVTLAEPRGVSADSGRITKLVATILLLGLVVYAMLRLFHLYIGTSYFHFVTAQIELTEGERWQRPGTFPNHRVEHYRSYWLSLGAISLVAVAITSLARSCRPSRMVRRPRLPYSFWLSIAGLACFNGWYKWIEYPRISPDLASAPPGISIWGIIGATLLAGGLCHVVGVRAARHLALAATVPITACPVRRSWLVPIAGLLIAAGTGWRLFDMHFEVDSLLTLFQDDDSWRHHLEILSYFFYSEQLLLLLLLMVSLHLIWRSLRRPLKQIDLIPVELRDYLIYSGAALLLLCVGLPALQAFGLAMWLGPDWGHFSPS